uniref:Speedy/RINGO cell cycle regulator family member E4 n=1 Tax=Gorilla gorilla gorilla TaxID=9595 RepID=G3S666_GORGO
MQKHYTVAWFLYSAPGVDPSPPCRSLGWKRKRERSDESEEEPEKELAPEPEETWVVEMLCGLKMKLKQQRVSPILPEHHKDFNSQLGRRTPQRKEWSDESEEEPEKELAPEPEETWVVETLCGLKMKLKKQRVSPILPEHHKDFNSQLGRRTPQRYWDHRLEPPLPYLLAMVIAYFSRAGFPSWLYQRIHFFLALYLANDMEEDDEDRKQNIFYFLNNRSQIALFQKHRFQFFCSMSGRAWVSPEELEEIQAYDPEHWVWARDRAHLS